VNQSEIYSLAKNAGLSDSKAKIAAAIAMAESGGNASAHSQDSDDNSYGLWQINMLGTMGPSRRALYGLKSNDDLLNPVTNAKVMAAISHNGQSFSAWTTYTSGRYKNWLSTGVNYVNTGFIDPSPGGVAGALAGRFLPGAIENTVGTSLDTLDAIVKLKGAVENTAHWVSNAKNWLRVAYVIGGGLLVYAGIETLVLPYTSKAVSKVMGVAGPGGKVSKAVTAVKNVGGSKS